MHRASEASVNRACCERTILLTWRGRYEDQQITTRYQFITYSFLSFFFYFLCRKIYGLLVTAQNQQCTIGNNSCLWSHWQHPFYFAHYTERARPILPGVSLPYSTDKRSHNSLSLFFRGVIWINEKLKLKLVKGVVLHVLHVLHVFYLFL